MKSVLKEVVIGRPCFLEEEIAAAVEVLRSGWIGAGPQTARFEEEFSRYIGCRHAVALSSCSAALEIALTALGIGPGDEVITTAMTFAATIHSILRTGARPVLVDIDRRSRNLDVERIPSALTPRTRAVVPVHLAGFPADMTQLGKTAAEYGLRVVQDCAHAIEAEWDGKKVGAYPDVACFSFSHSKSLTTVQGGMLCTDDEALAGRVRIIAQQGIDRDAWSRGLARISPFAYDVLATGQAARMNDVHAALGRPQISRLGAGLRRRAEIWAEYQGAFREIPAGLPHEPGGKHVHARHLYALAIDLDRSRLSRDGWLGELLKRGVRGAIHYPAIPHLTHFRRVLGIGPEAFPIARDTGERTLSIPFSAGLGDGEVAATIEAVLDVSRLAARG